MRLHVLSPRIKDKNLTKHCVPVWFTDWKEYTGQVDFSILFIHSCMCSVSYFMSLSSHTWTMGGGGEVGGGHVENIATPSRLLPLPGSWDKLWEVLHVVFFLDLSHGFAWELNWEASRAENTWWRASISEWFWMNASIFLHRQLWIFVSIV